MNSKKKLFNKLILLLGAIGVIVIVGILCVPTIHMAHPGRLKIIRAQSDMRSLATALEAYFIDARAYPDSIPLRTFVQNAEKLRDANGIHVHIPNPGNAFSNGLTTPIPFISTLFPDPFAPENSLTFAYYSDPESPGWILFSPGPDRRYDIVPTQDYDSATTQPSEKLILKTYDSTNGIESSGDIFRVKQ